jgi:Protein of unknown function (DUF2490)
MNGSSFLKNRLCLVLAASFLPVVAQAATEDFQTWNTVNLTTNVAKNVPLTVEFSGRMVDDSGRLGVVVLRPAIGYKFSDSLTVFLGHAHQKTINRGRADVDENRIYQQINWRIAKIGKATLASRTRIEQRWVEGARDMGWRVRERLQVQVPLKSKGANFVVSNEMLFALNTTDWGARAGFDQMRNFIGVNFPLSKAVSLETGYQNRYQERRGPADRMDHIIPITLNIKL